MQRWKRDDGYVVGRKCDSLTVHPSCLKHPCFSNLSINVAPLEVCLAVHVVVVLERQGS